MASPIFDPHAGARTANPLNARVPDGLRQAVYAAAARRGLTVSAFVREALSRAVLDIVLAEDTAAYG